MHYWLEEMNQKLKTYMGVLTKKNAELMVGALKDVQNKLGDVLCW